MDAAANENQRQLVDLVRDVWADEVETGIRFLSSPNPRLGNKSPIEVARTLEGLALAVELVHRLEEGTPL